jgi:hypothetical protein
MRRQAADSSKPATPKYGTQADLVMIPNAPWPMKQPATPTRRIQATAWLRDSVFMERRGSWI